MNEKFFDLKSEKQDRMINASLHFFAINGYKHASTDDIIKEAGISKGLLFHYFQSKQGLYEFLLDYSVRYLLFEYDREIGDEKDYFEYHDKLERAKLGVLKNYPYMYTFIDKCMSESSSDIQNMSRDALGKYTSQMNIYKSRLKTPALKSGVDLDQVETLLDYTIAGLTATSLEEGISSPDAIYNKIAEYIKLIKKLTINN